MKEVPERLDWVEAQVNCNASALFEQLAAKVEADVLINPLGHISMALICSQPDEGRMPQVALRGPFNKVARGRGAEVQVLDNDRLFQR